MDFVCVCNNCRKTIQKDFLYCPWCGKENAQPVDSAILEKIFSQLEVRQSNDRNVRIKKIENQLAEIEKSLKEMGAKI
jgi:hypothetical protein